MKKKILLFYSCIICASSYTTKAQSGKVLSLDGISTYMSVADHADLNFGSGQNKTISCWIKTTTNTGTPRIFAKRNGTAGYGYEFWTGNGSNAGKFAMNANGTGAPGNISTAAYSANSLADGTWHHIAMVIDASSNRTIYGYIDGVLANTSKSFTAISSDFSNTLNFIIGATSDTNNSYKWAGQIDNIRIWNKAMTATELLADMTAVVNAPTSNLLAAWDFENVSGTTVPDISGNNHPGTLFGTPTFPNAFSMVLALDGIDDFMSVADHSELNFTSGQSVTLTCKIKTTDYGKRIISKRTNGTGIGYEFINNSAAGGGQFGVNLTTSAGAAGPPFGTTTIANNTWHHLAMVVDAATTSCKIYVDGVLQQTKTSANIGTSTTSNTEKLLFGTLSNYASFMNAQLDDIRFWNKAMTATEVANDKTTQITGTEANLIASWDFENINGTTVPDISGHNHPGTLNNGASVIALTNEMQINSISLVQTELPTGLGDVNQRIVAVKTSVSGTINPLTVSTLKFTMTGTSAITDVTNIKIYASGINARFNPSTATLFGTVTPANGNLVVNGSQALANGDNYFWITYDVSATATEGNLLDATVESITANNVLYTPTNTIVSGNRVILLTNTLLYTPGDAGSANYRIPAIVTAADGSLVTVTDKRWNGAGDLSAKIDPIASRSTDNGKTWSTPIVLANFGGATGAGDAALVVDKTNGDIICIVSADKGFFASTNAVPAKVLVIRSTDNGISWGAPVDVTNQIYGPNPNWKALFVASGRAHQLRDGKLVAAIGVRENISGSERITNYMITSADHGVTWTASTGRAEIDGDEAKVVELNNGNIMMSIRNPGTRRFNLSTDKGATWGTAYNQSSISDPNCDGDFIRYTSTLDGYDKNRLLHSIPFSSSRRNVSVQMSTDEGTTWSSPKTIYPGASAYSSMTILADGTIGIYYENGESSIYQMYFTRFSLNWLTNGADTFVPAESMAAQKIAPAQTLSAVINPNPVEEVMTLTINNAQGNITIKIYDLNGALIRTVDLNENVTTTSFSVSDLNQGIYIVNVNDSNTTISNKIIKN